MEYGYDYEKSDHTQRITRLKVWIILSQHVDMVDLTLNFKPKAEKQGKCCFFVVPICALIAVAGLAAGLVFYFMDITPTTSTTTTTTPGPGKAGTLNKSIW